jgi:4-hydroxy-tetrahydrodipicolinate synthase
MEKFFGTGVALVTPFKSDNSIDVEALTRLVHFVSDNNVDYLIILGTTGEPATMSAAEHQLVIDTVILANSAKLPLVLGVGGNDTAGLVNKLKTDDLSAFSAILSVSPYYSKPTQEGIYQHFKALSEASPIPIILYNVPSRTGANVLPTTIARLAKECDNIIGVKEAAGDMIQAMRLLQLCPKDFLIISGDDMIALPMVLAGGAGVISVIGQGYPKEFSDMIRLGLEGKTSEAFEIHYKLMHCIDLIFEQGNPAGIKELLRLKGIMENMVRLPLVSADDILSLKMQQFLSEF